MSTATGDKSQHRAAELATAESCASGDVAPSVDPRRPYARPRLQRIGEVRDLTFGGSGTPQETSLPSKLGSPGRAPPHH